MTPRWIAVLLLAAAAPAAAQGGPPLLPGPAALAAIDERPAVREAIALQAAAEARARALEVGPHEFTLGGTWQERDVDGEGSFNEWEATLARGLRWPGKARVDRELGGVEVEIAENALADARHVEARALLAAWFDWLRGEAVAERDRLRAETLQRTLVAVRRQAELGEASAMQLDLAEAEAARARAAANRSSIEAARARRALAIAYPGLAVPQEPPAIPDPMPPPRPLEDWPAVILERSHELQLAELEARRRELRAERVQRDRWPDPVLGVRVLEERDGAEEAVGLVVAMQLPGRHRAALAAEARSESEAAGARLERMRRAIDDMARQDVADARAGMESWSQMAAASERAERYRERAERAYALGEATLGEFLLALSAATDTIHEARLARLDAHQALAQLAIDAHELWAPAGHDDHAH